MYRICLFVNLDDSEQAQGVAENVADLCEKIIGRPTTSNSPITYIVTIGPHWESSPELTADLFAGHLSAEDVETIMIPQPLGQHVN
jgi:hypothetical protein